MKTLKYIFTVMIGILLLASCKQEDILFNKDMSTVGFYGSTASVIEYDKTLAGKDSVVVQFLVTALTDAPSCDITFAIDSIYGTDTIKNFAVEGVDFEPITKTTITVKNGWGYYPLSIKAINNNDYDTNGNKSFYLKIVNNSLGYDLSSESSLLVTITDDDHPLGWMFGDYSVVTTEAGNGSTSHPGKISAMEGETNKIKIYGMCGSTYGPGLVDPFFIIGTVSDDHSTVTIASGQEWEDAPYGATILTVWQDDNGEGEEVDNLLGAIDETSGVVLTFSQQFTFMITEGTNINVGLQWSFNTDAAPNSATSVWTKQ